MAPLEISPDHPRECGANPAARHAERSHVGSSPRVRGKLICQLPPCPPERIIPASAGQTLEAIRTAHDCADHPRECGANFFVPTVVVVFAGSSPRVRGKLADKVAMLAAHRIIPASAGQTTTRCNRPVLRSDHPRECGANRPATSRWLAATGSSPRVRGKHAVLLYGVHFARIIPASAGQTAPIAHTTIGASDHPRECGANRE